MSSVAVRSHGVETILESSNDPIQYHYRRPISKMYEVCIQFIFKIYVEMDLIENMTYVDTFNGIGYRIG